MPSVTIGTAQYPSFESVADADTHLAADVLRADAWATRSTDQKGRGLASSTRAITALPWPTDGVPDIDNPPQVVADVTAMFAADLLSKPKLLSDASGNSNIKLTKAGGAEVEFWRPVDGGPPLPSELWNLLVSAGLIGMPDDYSPDDGPYVSGSNGPNCAAPGARWDRPPYWTSPYDPWCC